MKASLAIFGLATAMALPGVGSAANLNWNFLNDVPSHSSGVSVSSPHAFTDTKGDPTTITASLDPAKTGYTLFEKNGGSGETGLGVHPGAENEINVGLPGVELDLSQLLALHPTSISIAFNSVQAGEGGTVTYIDGDHDGDPSLFFKISDGNSHQLDLAELSEDGGSILVNATSGNILIADIAATVAPEPADAGLLGLGLIAAGTIIRRKLRAIMA